jgi:hypothetical protein
MNMPRLQFAIIGPYNSLNDEFVIQGQGQCSDIMICLLQHGAENTLVSPSFSNFGE